MRAFRAALGLSVLGIPPVGAAAQVPGPDYRSVGAAFTNVVFRNNDLTVAHVDLGRLGLDTNRLTALVTNATGAARVLGIGIRAEPGLWVYMAWQNSFRLEVPAHSTRRVEVAYLFRRMTPEASIRIVLGTPREAQGSISVVDRFADTTLFVGNGNPAASDPRPAFDTMVTEHFEVYAWRGSTGDRQMAAIASNREHALQRIAELMAVPFSGRIRLVLYPDSASKANQTGRIGNGYASGHTIVEIFNDSVQLDPYHEVAHIIAGERGSPPAVLNEGFAVYVSQLLGADALKYLGAPGRTVAEVTCGYVRSGEIIPLPRLFQFTDIGSDSTKPGVAYPEAASITAFLIEQYGIDRFRELYARLRNTMDAAELRRNAQTIEELYGLTIETIESAWRANLRCTQRQ